MKVFAVIRLRGPSNLKVKQEDTLKFMRLHKTNHLVLLPETDSVRGMLKKTEPFITWGEVETETIELLLKKRGFISGNKRISAEHIKEKGLKSLKEMAEKIQKNEKNTKELGVKPVFRLKPPKKGFERKGIKKHFNEGGAYGYRGKNINELIKKSA